jgi:hypothetical protein
MPPVVSGFHLLTARLFAQRRKFCTLLSRAAVSDNNLILESGQGKHARVMKENFFLHDGSCVQPGNKAPPTHHWQGATNPHEQVLHC